MEALNSNPANILQNVLKESDPVNNSIVRVGLVSLDENVARLQENVDSEKASGKSRPPKQNTEDNIREYLQKNRDGGLLIRIGFNWLDKSGRAKKDFGITFKLLKKLGLLSEERLAFYIADIYTRFNEEGNRYSANGDRLPYDPSYPIRGLSSSRPGLDGLKADIIRSSEIPTIPNLVVISGSPEALARIVDKGQYVPYQSKT